MASIKNKNTLVLCLLLLAGVILGGFLTEITKNVEFLSFLSFGRTFGLPLDSPLVLDLFVIQLKFAVQFHLDIATILGLVAAFFIYRKWF